MALLTLGGALKRKEMLSARFGDILSELYLLSAALKRWQDEGRQGADLAALQWCMAQGFKTIENRFAEILANLPNRFVAVVLKFLVQPFGARSLGPSDLVVHQCAQLVLEPSEAVKKGVITQGEGEKLAAAREAVAKVIEVDDFAPEALSPIYKKPAGVHQFFQEIGEQRAAS
jgi:acyl-CoA dehydrogenase